MGSGRSGRESRALAARREAAWPWRHAGLGGGKGREESGEEGEEEEGGRSVFFFPGLRIPALVGESLGVAEETWEITYNAETL